VSKYGIRLLMFDTKEETARWNYRDVKSLSFDSEVHRFILKIKIDDNRIDMFNFQTKKSEEIFDSIKHHLAENLREKNIEKPEKLLEQATREVKKCPKKIGRKQNITGDSPPPNQRLSHLVVTQSPQKFEKLITPSKNVNQTLLPDLELDEKECHHRHHNHKKPRRSVSHKTLNSHKSHSASPFKQPSTECKKKKIEKSSSPSKFKSPKYNTPIKKSSKKNKKQFRDPDEIYDSKFWNKEDDSADEGDKIVIGKWEKIKESEEFLEKIEEITKNREDRDMSPTFNRKVKIEEITKNKEDRDMSPTFKRKVIKQPTFDECVALDES